MRTLLGIGLRTAVTSNGGTMPVKKIYRCAGQLTRAADAVITMQAGKAFYKATDSTAPAHHRAGIRVRRASHRRRGQYHRL